MVGFLLLYMRLFGIGGFGKQTGLDPEVFFRGWVFVELDAERFELFAGSGVQAADGVVVFVNGGEEPAFVFCEEGDIFRAVGSQPALDMPGTQYIPADFWGNGVEVDVEVGVGLG